MTALQVDLLDRLPARAEPVRTLFPGGLILPSGRLACRSSPDMRQAWPDRRCTRRCLRARSAFRRDVVVEAEEVVRIPALLERHEAIPRLRGVGLACLRLTF